MKALITGGAGFIGSHLADRLVSDGHEVVVVDDLSSGARGNLDACMSEIEFIESDIRSIGEHSDSFDDVDVVFHLAALISGYDSLQSPEAYWDVNIGGLHRLFAALPKRQLRFVLASSSTVYGLRGGLMQESTPTSPATVYALTKLAGEHLLSMYAGILELHPVSLRLFNVYGPRQNPNHPYANVTCKFAAAAAQGLPVILYGDGEQTRDFIFVDDVVDAFCRVAHGAQKQVYNIGTNVETSIAELLDLAQRLGRETLDVEKLPSWPNDIRSIRADTEAFDTEFRIQKRHHLEDGLRKTIEFFRLSSK
jgi:UDP-glucose 4-epimerase